MVLTKPDIKAIAAKHEVTTGQVVLAYLLQLGISVIPKSARKERLAENFAAAELTLTRAEMDVMNSLDGREGFGRMFNDPRDFPGAEG